MVWTVQSSQGDIALCERTLAAGPIQVRPASTTRRTYQTLTGFSFKMRTRHFYISMTGAQEDDFLMDANYVFGRWVWSKLSVCIYMARLRNSVKISSARSIHFHYFHLRRDERFGGGTRAVIYVVCLSRVA